MQKTDIRYCNTVIQMLEAELAEKTRLLSETDVAVIKIANQADEYLQQRNVAIEKVEELRVRFERELAAAQAQRDSAREWVRATLGSAHLKEMDDFIKEEE